MVFGASSLYLVLRVGLTVSASIPVAVISITLFRILAKFGMRNANILQNNIVQTAGSAGESIAFGVGVTMPAIMILGFDLELTRVMLVAVLGGLLGILMMIPLRRVLIVQNHGELKYPEGTACAAVLIAGASEESKAVAAEHKPEGSRATSSAETQSGAATIFTGFGIGVIYKAVMVALKGWKDTPEKVFGAPFKSGSVAAEISPELLGVGYIIGPRLAGIMCGGGVLAYLVLIPLIKYFGENLTGPLAPGTVPISEMGPNAIRGAYILYIGAGAVAAAGIISLLRALPTIWHSIQESLRDLSALRTGSAERKPRTDQDLSMKVVLIGILALVAIITAAPALHMKVLGAVLIIAFGFLFVTVSSRLTGEIGSTSNPISGMTVATLLLTCLIFLMLGWTGPTYYVTALSVGAIVCIASSNGGTTSQDLKTGFLVGATPRLQQIAIMVGALASALVLGPILLRLNDAATVYVRPTESLRTDVSQLTKREKLQGPQATEDPNEYFVWHKIDEVGGPSGKYLVNPEGAVVYHVDPGINGTVTTRPDGTRVTKFDAPKATLMSYVIKGILNRQLPWGLVLLGVMIAVVLEMAGVPSLAFAVGVYLPLSATTPIFTGGLIRWATDRYVRRKHQHANLTPEELVAEGDKSPGVLLASGYIAGGAIAGIIIAFMAGVLGPLTERLTAWSNTHNPFYNGDYANVLALIPFVAICLFLYLVGREVLMRGRSGAR
jgi:putative OPT family oligopeptide transporter